MIRVPTIMHNPRKKYCNAVGVSIKYVGNHNLYLYSAVAHEIRLGGVVGGTGGDGDVEESFVVELGMRGMVLGRSRPHFLPRVFRADAIRILRAPLSAFLKYSEGHGVPVGPPSSTVC